MMLRFLKNNMLVAICGVGIFQAIVVNILKINIPFLTIFSLSYLSFTYFGVTKEKLALVKFNFPFYLLVLALLVLYLFAIAHSWENTSEIAFHLNVIVSLIFGKTIGKDPTVKFEVPVNILWAYMLISFMIYFFAWEQVAGLMEGGSESLGLKTNGFNRLFGLLFNPLANAYFLLIMFFFTYAIREKGLKSFKLALLFSIFLALTRGAMVSVALFIALYLLYRRKWFMILFCLLIALICYLTIEPVKIIIDSIITLEDTQGSAQGHEESLRRAIETLIENPFGLGFTELHTESWVFNYGVYYGYAGILVLLSFFGYISLKLLLKRKLFYFILFISFLPITLIIPFHTFNLPILLFFVFTYFLYYNKPNYENWI